MRAITAVALGLALAAVAGAEVAVTIYNQNIALVRDTREFEFPKGVGTVRFTDVAAQIIPTSVAFRSDKATLLEQNYDYDLVSASKLLQKYIDNDVEVSIEGPESFRGRLLAAGDDVVIRELDGSLRSLMRSKIINVHFPSLPEGLITRPTLVWLVDSPKGGKGAAEVTYLTNGLKWEADYVAVLAENDQSLSLSGWVNITNNCGATYRDAQIKLMAGDVQLVQPERSMPYFKAMAGDALGEAQFVEESFYEYHLYTLQRPSTLQDNQIKQVSLFPSADVKSLKKEFRYDSHDQRRGKSDNVRVTLEFANTQKNGLGIPLPAGKVRLYKGAKSGSLEFIGEDKIDHTPREEPVRVSTGYAFDIVGERTVLDKKQRGREQQVQVKIRNRKKESVEVIVAEHIYGDWRILEADPADWEKKSASLVEWRLKLKPDEEKTITYRSLVQ